jgi:hypothetical protein
MFAAYVGGIIGGPTLPHEMQRSPSERLLALIVSGAARWVAF